MSTNVSVEKYSPVSDQRPTATIGHRVICDSSGHGLFVVGGWKNGYVQDNFVRQVWYYNFSSKLWTQLKSSNAPVSLANHTVSKLDQRKFLVYGGSLLGREVRGNSNETFIYDTLYQNWQKLETKGEPCPQPSRHWFGQALCRHGDDVYVATGRRGHNDASNLLIHKLNLHTLTWQYLSKPETEPSGRVRHEIVCYDKRLYIFGGAQCSYDNTFGLDVIPTFDTTSRTWSQLTTIPDPVQGYPEPRTCHTSILYNDCVYICGGYYIPPSVDGQAVDSTSSRSFDDIWKFHLPTKKWQQMSAHLPTALWSHAADVTQDGRMYIFGGCSKRDCKVRTNDMFKYTVDVQKLEQLSWDQVVTNYSNCSASNSLDSSTFCVHFLDKFKF